MDTAVEPLHGYANDQIMLQSMLRLDELLHQELLPPCPFLLGEFSDIASIEEIRRTLVAADIDETVSGQELLDFFGDAGEVKYIKFCMRKNDPLRYCLIEFSSLYSIVNGLKLNNRTLHGRMIKVYHSVEAIEKPSYLNDPESFKQYLMELKSLVEDSYKIIQEAANDVNEYEEYCLDNQLPSKSPLKNAETAIAEIEEALSKVLSAQSLISVSISPVESDLVSILGETVGHREPIPSSPESFLKYISQKRDHFGQEELTNSLKKEPLKSSKLDSRNFRRRHRGRSSERKDKYHGLSAGNSGKSSLHHNERSKSHDSRSRRHARDSSLHCPLVSSNFNGDSASGSGAHLVVVKSKKYDLTSGGVGSESNEASQDERAVTVKSIRKMSGDGSEKENDDQERKHLISNSEVPTSTTSHEKIEISLERNMQEDSIGSFRHQTLSVENHSHSDRRSSSRSYGGRRRSSRSRDLRKSPILHSRDRSPPPCEKERRRRLNKRGSRSPCLDHHYWHHHHHQRSSWTWHSGLGDHTSRKLASSSSHGERWRSSGTHYSSRHAAKSHVRSPRRHRNRPRDRSSSKDKQEEGSQEKRSHHHSDCAVVRVYPESFEDYLEDFDGEVGEEKEVYSSQSEDVSKTETASGGSSQNDSANSVECGDEEGSENQ